MNKNDPTVTDPDKYKVVLENEKVRVLDYKDKPGDKTSKHFHPKFVLYALSSFERKIHLPNGKVIDRKFNEGDVIWSDEQAHIGENVGTSDTHVLMVEIK